MTWSLALLGFFIHIDAQKDPVAALAAAAAAALALWFVVVQSRRREERRAEATRERNDRQPRNW